jgi:hypothetical protein
VAWIRRRIIEKTGTVDEAKLKELFNPAAPDWMTGAPGAGYRALRIAGTIVLWITAGLVTFFFVNPRWCAWISTRRFDRKHQHVPDDPFVASTMRRMRTERRQMAGVRNALRVVALADRRRRARECRAGILAQLDDRTSRCVGAGCVGSRG